MTLKEREEKLEALKRMKTQFSDASIQLKARINSFEILCNMCEYLINGLEKREDLDYETLEKFINNEYKRIIEDYGKRESY